MHLPIRLRHLLYVLTGSWRLTGAGLAVLVAVGACAGPDASVAGGPVPWVVESVAPPTPSAAGMPHLSPLGDGAVLSWWTPVAALGGEAGPDGDSAGPSSGGRTGAGGGGWALQTAAWSPASGFGPVREVTRGAAFFVNWADFPSVVPVTGDHWVAHWLQRTGDATYAYGVRVSETRDGGATWGEPWTPHEDGSPTEHGFAAILPHGPGAREADGGWEMVWLDGRKYADGDHGAATDEMTVRWRSVAADGTPGHERLLDDRACDCCQTDMAWTSRGPVAVYRDRSPDEVRDIYLVRREADGWTEPRPVHRDGWVIGGCPVNGPAVATRGDQVAVAWFTGAGDTARVRLAVSDDAGDTFSAPVRVDDGRPVGRVDVVWTDFGAAVLWLEETGAGRAELRVRAVTPGGGASSALTVARTGAARASGFPQLAGVGGGALLAAWTVPGEGAAGGRVELALLRPAAEPGGGDS